MIRVLFVDDEPRILDGLKRVLRSRRTEWDITFTQSGAAALEALSQAPHDIVFTDMRMPEMDGVLLLARIRDLHPSTLRVLLSGQTDIEAGVRASAVAHQFLTKPCDQAAISERVNVAERLRTVLADSELRAFAGGVSGLPCLDTARRALEACLANPNATANQVAAIAEMDIALSIKLVQLASSSFFAPPRRIAGVGTAVERLGLDVVRSLVQSAALFAAERFTLHPRFSIEAHNHAAAQAGREARAQCADATQGDEAYLRAMVAHVGTLLLAARGNSALDDAALANAAGAYLLGLWGFPAELIEHAAEPESRRRAA